VRSATGSPQKRTEGPYYIETDKIRKDITEDGEGIPLLLSSSRYTVGEPPLGLSGSLPR
jgi:hypothetical protein